MVAIIDYDAGNIKSVEKACDFLGYETVITRDEKILLQADHVILPGVGAFGDAMQRLHGYGLVSVIRELAARQTPLLGICLGLQLLFDGSEESGGVPGLGILSGDILRFDEHMADETGRRLRVPHMGWNAIITAEDEPLFSDITSSPDVYFVHSYYLRAKDRSIVAATSTYGVTFDAAVSAKAVAACQFHPEKSGRVGLRILHNFLQNGEQTC